MSYDVFADDLTAIEIHPNKKQIINTINPHSYITAKDDSLFQEALRHSDILLPDGSGIVVATKYLKQKQIKKIAGSDLHPHLLYLLNQQGGRCFYMGSSQDTLDKIQSRLLVEYPNIKARFYSPPYKEHFSDKDNEEILDTIDCFKPDVLFVGLTAPKQEKWLQEHKDDIDASVLCCIGAVFDFYAGTVKRPSQFWLDLHLEWLPRLLNEPKRLWRRNFVSTPLFLWDLFLYKIRVRR